MFPLYPKKEEKDPMVRKASQGKIHYDGFYHPVDPKFNGTEFLVVEPPNSDKLHLYPDKDLNNEPIIVDKYPPLENKNKRKVSKNGQISINQKKRKIHEKYAGKIIYFEMALEENKIHYFEDKEMKIKIKSSEMDAKDREKLEKVPVIGKRGRIGYNK